MHTEAGFIPVPTDVCEIVSDDGPQNGLDNIISAVGLDARETLDIKPYLETREANQTDKKPFGIFGQSDGPQRRTISLGPSPDLRESRLINMELGFSKTTGIEIPRRIRHGLKVSLCVNVEVDELLQIRRVEVFVMSSSPDEFINDAFHRKRGVSSPCEEI